MDGMLLEQCLLFRMTWQMQKQPISSSRDQPLEFLSCLMMLELVFTNIQGLIIGGSSEFKNELNSSGLLDERLQVKVYQTIDLSYGGEAGFNQAIDSCSSVLSDIKFIKEKKTFTILL